MTTTSCVTELQRFTISPRTLTLRPAFLQPKPKIVVGNTLALENACTHYFLDGQVGVRVEEPEGIKVSLRRALSFDFCSRDVIFQVIKTGLLALSRINKEMRNPSAEMKCSKCGKVDSKNRCTRCQTLYCSKVRCSSLPHSIGELLALSFYACRSVKPLVSDFQPQLGRS